MYRMMIDTMAKHSFIIEKLVRFHQLTGHEAPWAPHAGAGALVGAAVGAAVGALIGALVGAATGAVGAAGAPPLPALAC
jgi:hypothetical protein